MRNKLLNAEYFSNKIRPTVQAPEKLTSRQTQTIYNYTVYRAIQTCREAAFQNPLLLIHRCLKHVR
jgi:hypothetical protein